MGRQKRGAREQKNRSRQMIEVLESRVLLSVSYATLVLNAPALPVGVTGPVVVTPVSGGTVSGGTGSSAGFTMSGVTTSYSSVLNINSGSIQFGSNNNGWGPQP